MPGRSAPNTYRVHDRNGRMIKLKCDYSSLAEMFGRSRDPITSREHRGRGGEGWTVYDEPGIPRTMEKKKRGKSEERDRVAEKERDGQGLETEGWIILEANKLRPSFFVPARKKRSAVCPRY